MFGVVVSGFSFNRRLNPICSKQQSLSPHKAMPSSLSATSRRSAAEPYRFLISHTKSVSERNVEAQKHENQGMGVYDDTTVSKWMLH